MSVIDDIARLVDARRSTRGNQIGFCPGHDDSSRSFTFKMGDNGIPLLKCWAGCQFEYLRSVLVQKGISQKELERAREPEKKDAAIGLGFKHPDVGSFFCEFDRYDMKLVKIYKFHDRNGTFVAFKARFEPKTFRQFIYNGYDRCKSGKINGLPYRLPEVIQAIKEGQPVHIFEGEKDADNAYDLGLDTTSFGCATDPLPHEYWVDFANASCVVWADNDAPGLKRVEEVALQLYRNNCKVKVIVPPKGKDFSDWQAAGATIEDIATVVKATPLWKPAAEVSKDMAEKGLFPLTPYTIGSEAFAGDYYAHKFSRKLKYCVDFKEFMHFDGKVWQQDKGGIHHELAKSLAVHLRTDLQEVDQAKRVAMEKLAAKAESDSGRKAIISCAKTVERIRVDSVKFDDKSTAHLLCCEDGVINLRTGEILSHSPDYFLTRHVPQRIDPDGEPSWFLQYLHQAFPNDNEVVEWLLYYLGYCLTGETWFQKFLIMVGAAGSGKSQLQKIMRGLMGVHCDDIDSKSLAAAKHRTAGVESDLANIRGKRLIFSSELEPKQTLDIEILKALTGGDVVRLKFMGKDKFSMTSLAKLIFTSQDRPVLSVDDGVARRLIELQWQHKPSSIVLDLAEKMLAKEASQIFGYLVKRAVKTYEKPSVLNVPKAIQNWTEEYLGEMDYLKQWNELNAMFVQGAFTSSRMLFEDIDKYFRENHLPFEFNARMVTNRLRKFGYKPEMQNGVRGWSNVRLM